MQFKTTLALSVVLAFISSYAQGNTRFDLKRAFIKVNQGYTLPESDLITEAKPLFGGNYLVQTPNVLKLEKELKGNPAIKRIERNYYAEKRVLPQIENFKGNEPLDMFSAFNDPKIGKVWSFRDASRNGVSVNKAYVSPLNTKKEQIIVAVVDTGVDYNHEDLKNIMWKNPGEIAGNGIDDDNNGYVDDIYGIDTLDGDTDPMASHEHGTHVSGTIAAQQNNNIGIAGIASKVKIMAIRTVPDSADETDAHVVESYLYAAKNGARLINCSFGKNHNEGGMIVKETIDHIAQTYGTLVFAAAGNDYGRNIDSNPTYPASYTSDGLIVIASTTKNGGLSYFSNVGKKSVDVAAPGSGIYSTLPGNSYGSMSGTSMATPTTVGVAAEILSHFPEMDGISLKNVLINSVTKVKAFKNKMVSGGRVDLVSGLQYTLDNYSDIEQRQDQRQQQQQSQQH